MSDAGQDHIEIYQWDGTCFGGLGTERVLLEVMEELEKNGLLPKRPEKRCLPGPVDPMPGRPTNNCNVCSISLEQFHRYARWLAARGFQAWPADTSPVDELYREETAVLPGECSDDLPEVTLLTALDGYFVQIYFGQREVADAVVPGQLSLQVDPETGRVLKAWVQ